MPCLLNKLSDVLIYCVTFLTTCLFICQFEMLFIYGLELPVSSLIEGAQLVLHNKPLK